MRGVYLGRAGDNDPVSDLKLYAISDVRGPPDDAVEERVLLRVFDCEVDGCRVVLADARDLSFDAARVGQQRGVHLREKIRD